MRSERFVEVNYGLQIDTWYIGAIKTDEDGVRIRAVNFLNLDPMNMIKIQRSFLERKNFPLPGFIFRVGPRKETIELYKRFMKNLGKSAVLLFKRDESNTHQEIVNLYLIIRDEIVEDEELPVSYRIQRF